MKQFIFKHSKICKILLCLMLTIGCNLSIEGHFWPDDILPYVFFVLCAGAVSGLDLREEAASCRGKNFPAGKEFFRGKCRLWAALIIIASILAQVLILQIYKNDTIVIIIKAAVKAVIAGVSLGCILIAALRRMIKEKRRVEGPFIILALWTLIYFYFIKRISAGFSLYPFILLLLIYIVKSDIQEKTAVFLIKKASKREKLITGAGAALLALFETLGYMALNYYRYSGGLIKCLLLALSGAAAWGFVFYYVLAVLFIMSERIQKAGATENTASEGKGKKDASPGVMSGKRLIVCFIITAAVRVIYWFNWFPALLSKDTYVQLQQALGNEPYSNHHPWLHTMLIKLFMSIGRLIFGSNQAGVALNAFASLLFSSILITLILRYFYGKAPSGVWRLAAFILIFDPIHCVYSVTIWKDVLFAYALLAFCFLLMAMDGQIKEKGSPRPYMWALYAALSFLFCFSRTNGLYAWLFTLPFLLWHYRKNLMPWLISTLVCLALIFGYKGLILPYFNVIEPDTVEALSVPLQQVAFTVRQGGEFSEYDRSVINNIVDMEAMGERYDAHISDPVKNLIRDRGSQEYISENKLEFLKMYISVGIKNPTDYIVAFLNQSRGYWYQKMSNYIYYSEGVHEYAGEIGINRTPLFPEKFSAALDTLMDKYCGLWHKLWSLALSTYLVWIFFVYMLADKRTCFYFLPVIAVFLTLLIATPVNDEFRYAYGIYLALPLLMMKVSYVKNACISFNI